MHRLKQKQSFKKLVHIIASMRRRLCIRFQYWESPVATACKEEKPKAEKPICTCSIFGKTRTRIYQFCSQRERNFVLLDRRPHDSWKMLLMAKSRR
jgi:hypothetical protein